MFSYYWGRAEVSLSSLQCSPERRLVKRTQMYIEGEMHSSAELGKVFLKKVAMAK